MARRTVVDEDSGEVAETRPARRMVEEEPVGDEDVVRETSSDVPDEDQKSPFVEDGDEMIDASGTTAPAEQGVISQERMASAERIVNSIVSLDPEAIFNDLEKHERVTLSLVAVMRAQAEVLSRANAASKLQFTLSRDAKVYREVEKASLMAALRGRALTEMPRERTAKGDKDKAPAAAAVEDYLFQNFGADMERIRVREIELDQLAGHAERIAKNWAYFSRNLESMAQNLRSTGDADGGRRGTDD